MTSCKNLDKIEIELKKLLYPNFIQMFFSLYQDFKLIKSGKIWIKSGKISGQNPDKIWTRYGQNMDKIWTKYG